MTTQEAQPKTRLAEFLATAPFSTGRLARSADMPLATVTNLATGRSTPRADTMERLRKAASTLYGREIALSEMFGDYFGA